MRELHRIIYQCEHCGTCGDVKWAIEHESNPCNSTIHSGILLANQSITRAVIDQLLHEAQERWPVSIKIFREEVIAWLDSRTTHWFTTHKGQ
jgi:hypothetical protein